MVQKIFVNKEKIIHVSCPECGRKRDKDVSKYLILDQAVQLKYKCPCGHNFSILLERRQYVRKKVNFIGSLICGKVKYSVLIIDILVLDISRYGLKIKLIDRVDIEKDQKVTVEFQLDDKGKSRVSKEAVVRNVMLPSIGVEFLSHNHYDKFGAYMLFYFNDL